MAEVHHWMQSAVEHHGAATEAAEKEGLSVHAWAEKHEHDEGTTGHRARLALVFEKEAHKRKKKEPHHALYPSKDPDHDGDVHE